MSSEFRGKILSRLIASSPGFGEASKGRPLWPSAFRLKWAGTGNREQGREKGEGKACPTSQVPNKPSRVPGPRSHVMTGTSDVITETSNVVRRTSYVKRRTKEQTPCSLHLLAFLRGPSRESPERAPLASLCVQAFRQKQLTQSREKSLLTHHPPRPCLSFSVNLLSVFCEIAYNL